MRLGRSAELPSELYPLICTGRDADAQEVYALAPVTAWAGGTCQQVGTVVKTLSYLLTADTIRHPISSK